MNTAFIGLGVMGYPMAGHLQKNGHRVTVYNRRAEKAEKWVAEHGGQSAPSPYEATLNADFVFMCVGNDNDIRSVSYGESGIVSGMKPGAVLIDHTTASKEIALELADVCEKSNVAFLDAPISGGQSGAENGQLTIMVGGRQHAYDKVSSLLDCYAKKHVLMGPNGHGQLTKMVNQVCISGVLQGLSEGLLLADSAGVDGKKMIAVISNGAAQSWQMDNRAGTMIDNRFDFGFAVDLMIKDLGICLDTADKLGIELPLAASVKTNYEKLSADGKGRFDTSILYHSLKKKDF